jgi:hypothetical protein
LADFLVEGGEEEEALVEAELDLVEEFLGSNGSHGVEVRSQFPGPDDEGVSADVEVFGALGVGKAVGAEGEELVFDGLGVGHFRYLL